MIKNIVAAFLGGGFGASLRFILMYLFAQKYSFPVITFGINIFACLIMGFLCAIFIDKTNFSEPVKIIFTAGFCGGFSTFTALSMELLKMIETQQIIEAVIYVLLTIVIGLLAAWAGVNIAKLL